MSAPSEAPPAELIKARERANTLELKANELEKQARRARRRANSAQEHYQAMLRRHRGEQPLPFHFEES